MGNSPSLCPKKSAEEGEISISEAPKKNFDIASPIKTDIPPEEPPKEEPKPIEKDIIIKCSIEAMMKTFFKDYVIVWHDPNVENQENKHYIAELKKFCEVFTFTEWEKAKDYIKDTQAVCHVLTSGTNGELLVKEISEYDNVCNLYVFCLNKEHHSTWTRSYPKVSCVETDLKSVTNQIQQNLLEWYKKKSSLNFNLPAFAPIFNDGDKSVMNHLHLYLKVIPNFNNREQAKDDLINLAKAIYTDSNNQKHIADFEANYNGYNKEQILKWYTLETFFYKVINNCLRIATSDSIQYCRLPLKDIEQAIKDQYQEKSKNFNGLLYRGTYVSEQEWSSLKENKDKEIEMLGFLSVSKVKNVALKFMNQNLSKMALITIIVPKGPNSEEQGFAEMEEYSRFPKEKEILFNVRSRFTVLETEDDYELSATAKCRHLVLLYGAQGFRKFASEQNPVQDVSLPNIENISCAHCSIKSEKFWFTSITNPQYYCKACIEHGIGPFLCITPTMNQSVAKIKGCPLMNSPTPFYGYKCCNCQAKRQKSYFICTDGCGKKWCENCFDTTLACRQAGHKILLETSPYTFWCEQMSENEFNHLKFQNSLMMKTNHKFQQAEVYFETHEYEKVVEYYNLYIHQNEVNNKNDDLAYSYNSLGRAYNAQGKHRQALESYLKSLEIMKYVHGIENLPEIAIVYDNIGEVYINQGEIERALEYHFKALEIKKSVECDNHLKIAESYNRIGTAYIHQGDYKKSLEYHLKSLDIEKSVFGEKDPKIAVSYNNIGGIYSHQGEYNKALENHLKALEIQKSIHGDIHLQTAVSYGNVGMVYDRQGEYEKALEYVLKSLEILKSVYGRNKHIEIARSYNNIGQIYLNKGEHKKALEYHLKSLEIQKSIYGSDNHPNTALSYNNVGMIYYRQGECKKALKYLSQALEIQKSVYGGADHPNMAKLYENIGIIYSDQGEPKKALDFHLKALEIQKSAYGSDNHPGIATSYNNIGMVYYDQGEFQKALEYLSKSLEIQKAVHASDNHPDIARGYINIGLLYANQKEDKMALDYYLKALDIYKSVYGSSDHPDIATCYNNIGMVYSREGENKKALEYYLKTLEIYESVYGSDNHPDIATCFNNIGTAYYDAGENKKAFEYYLKALDIYESVYGSDNHPATISSYSNLAMKYHDQGEEKKALEYFFKSQGTYKEVYGGNHP